jgi:putative transposase
VRAGARPDHVLAAARYIELNPARARLVARPEDWPWSSAGALLARRVDRLVAATTPLLDEAGDWATLLASGLDDPRLDAVRRHARTGRPLGSEEFVADLEQRLGRRLRPARRGRKPAQREEEGPHGSFDTIECPV